MNKCDISLYHNTFRFAIFFVKKIEKMWRYKKRTPQILRISVFAFILEWKRFLPLGQGSRFPLRFRGVFRLLFASMLARRRVPYE